MSMIRDRIWLWGQTPGSHHGYNNYYNLPGVNKMDSAEGCRFFGIDKCCRVAMSAGPFPPFDAEAEKIKGLGEVVWSAVGSGGIKEHSDDKSDLDEVLRMAEIYPNVTGAVLDDFFSSVEFADTKLARHSVGSIRDMRDRLHGFPGRRLDLWMVWYTYQLGYDVREYTDLCDVVTMWTWKGSELAALEENMRVFVEKTPGKRRLAGCYMWNYGEQRPLEMELMEYQCRKYHEWLREGRIEGIVLCSNCIADLGLETVEWTRKWLAEIGGEEV